MGINLPVFTVDAFTSSPFSGNPAAVCLLSNDAEISDDVKQKIAAEFKLSETVYIAKLDAKDSFEKASHFGLRWFTPAKEVPLCGHGTLAAAAILFNIYGNDSLQLHFKTLSGELLARRKKEFISLDMPINKPQKWIEDESTKELIKAVIGSLPYDDVQYNNTTRKLLIRLSDSLTKDHLQKINPSPKLMLEANNSGQIRGVILTMKGKENDEYDFMSRYFAPWMGVDEDPVCGSAHTVSGPYWSEILHKNELFARQCSARGGDLWLKLEDDQRMELRGTATILIRGNLQL